MCMFFINLIILIVKLFSFTTVSLIKLEEKIVIEGGNKKKIWIILYFYDNITEIDLVILSMICSFWKVGKRKL